VRGPDADDPEAADEDAGGPSPTGKNKLSPEEQARVDATALSLGRFLPAGMVIGAVAGILAGWLTHRFGVCIPVGVALGILIAGTLPVFTRR